MRPSEGGEAPIENWLRQWHQAVLAGYPGARIFVQRVTGDWNEVELGD